MLPIRLVATEDGSHTLYAEHLNETYHSLSGAYRESLYVYIQKGLQVFHEENPTKKVIHIFEVGFGTGLNAFLSLQFAEEHQLTIHYTSIEPYPLPEDLLATINYAQFFPAPLQPYWSAIHACSWEEKHEISPFFNLKKLAVKLEDLPLLPQEFDVVYFDAFAPKKQSELWEIPQLQKCKDLLLPNGLLVTYCAKGQFKRDLQAVGFQVEKLAGALGKKEMTRGRVK
jgi:tRNA U34 5-methylaminomethyl-2-thiouridine-forming methyltransferase MnmC